MVVPKQFVGRLPCDVAAVVVCLWSCCSCCLSVKLLQLLSVCEVAVCLWSCCSCCLYVKLLSVFEVVYLWCCCLQLSVCEVGAVAICLWCCCLQLLSVCDVAACSCCLSVMLIWDHRSRMCEWGWSEEIIDLGCEWGCLKEIIDLGYPNTCRLRLILGDHRFRFDLRRT